MGPPGTRNVCVSVGTESEAIPEKTSHARDLPVNVREHFEKVKHEIKSFLMSSEDVGCSFSIYFQK